MNLKLLSDYMGSLPSVIDNLYEAIDIEVVSQDKDKYKQSPILEWSIPSYSSDLVPTITVTIKYLPNVELTDMRYIQDIALMVMSDVINKMKIDQLLPDYNLQVTPVGPDSNQFRGFQFSAEMALQLSTCV